MPDSLSLYFHKWLAMPPHYNCNDRQPRCIGTNLTILMCSISGAIVRKATIYDPADIFSNLSVLA